MASKVPNRRSDAPRGVRIVATSHLTFRGKRPSAQKTFRAFRVVYVEDADLAARNILKSPDVSGNIQNSLKDRALVGASNDQGRRHTTKEACKRVTSES